MDTFKLSKMIGYQQIIVFCKLLTAYFPFVLDENTRCLIRNKLAIVVLLNECMHACTVHLDVMVQTEENNSVFGKDINNGEWGTFPIYLLQQFWQKDKVDE